MQTPRWRRFERQVKPTCVKLMGIATQPPTTTSQHAALLDSLRALVETLPDAAFAPSLINYLLFPLTTLLRQTPDPAHLPDTFLEAAFRFLAVVVHHWVRAPGGMDPQAWEQLWRFTISSITRPGKGRAVEQEVQFEAVALLRALLEPYSAPGEAPHPSPAMRKALYGPKAPLVPTLFQSITLAVECSSPAPPHPALQLSAVKLLRTLVGYLAGQSELLASVLPGIVSAMTKAITSGGKGLKGDNAAEMAHAIEDILTETLDDDALRRLGVLKPTFNDLSELAEQWEEKRRDGNGDELSPESTPPPETPPSTAAPNPFPPLTASYLAFTSTQLLSTIPPVLSTLARHFSHSARNAAADLASSLIRHCRESLPRLTSPALSTLLLLSTDEFDPVRNDAKQRLLALLDSDAGVSLDNLMVDLLSTAINALPRHIQAEQDSRVNEVARLISAIALVTAEQDPARPNVIATFLGPSGAVERWAWGLLDCLEFGRPRGWSAAGADASRTAEQGWTGGLITASLPRLIEPAGGATDSAMDQDESDTRPPPNETFPSLPLRHVESDSTRHALSSMLEALGAAGGEQALHSVDYFIRFARANRTREVAKAVSAVWVAQKLLVGVASKHDGERRPRAVRKMAREVTRVLVSIDDEDDEDEEWTGQPDPDLVDALVPVEHSRGLDALTTLLDKPMANQSASQETRRLHSRAQRVLLSALSLSTLASCAKILGTGFRPLLLHTLYEVLAHLSSPHDIVRQFAETALVLIAYETGYASAQNLVLDNVDYVVNVVSQRLTYHRLSPHAPLVLIAMIRLVGAPIVPLVHDVVDEIFDALDDFHGYSALASALLAVLTTLIDVMADDVKATGPTPERKAAREEARRVLNPPNPETDFARFAGWYSERSTHAQREVDEILERAPRQAWGKDKDAEGDTEMGDEERPPNTDNDEPPPPTRSQEVAQQILEKATYYLSHSSPFLRARVLGLIARAIPVLASGGREGDLLPLIDRAWPIILTRLDDPVPYVVTEAAEVIASLAEHVGEYVSRRIADDAWPRLLRLLNSQAEVDKKSALARRGAVGTTSEWTVSHRLHLALLSTATFIAAEVPVKDGVLWEIITAFVPLLDARVHGDLQEAARKLYSALDARDGDAVWMALRATSGRLKGDNGVWEYLHDGALDISASVAVLAP
ncbi:TELO2-interacting protein 1 [Vanrija pseudolonga]|uniref:TELO2-interacting protein 1 n=1 Tax=Vanrija pseudolonga TaxID=143232 RepID=A0AAF1BHG8_9TREE|nr:TELO2-interacting protein 1 [Vanrija pseudolonga]